MPGAKQKKRSPAEIEAERQAQLAAELAEQQARAEREEQERRRREAEELHQKMLAAQRRQEELYRLRAEAKLQEADDIAWQQRVAAYVKTKTEVKDWATFQSCSRSIDAASQPAINAFISRIADEDKDLRDAVKTGLGTALAANVSSAQVTAGSLATPSPTVSLGLPEFGPAQSASITSETLMFGGILPPPATSAGSGASGEGQNALWPHGGSRNVTANPHASGKGYSHTSHATPSTGTGPHRWGVATPSLSSAGTGSGSSGAKHGLQSFPLNYQLGLRLAPPIAVTGPGTLHSQRDGASAAFRLGFRASGHPHHSVGQGHAHAAGPIRAASVGGFAPTHASPGRAHAAAIHESTTLATPLGPGMQALTSIATVADDADRARADALEADDGQQAIRSSAYLSNLRDMMADKLDMLTWSLLNSATEWGVEIKDGLKELLVTDAYTVSPLDDAAAQQELRNPFSIPRIVGEVTIWAHLGPGKLTRNKKLYNVGQRGPLHTATLEVEVHKGILAAQGPTGGTGPAAVAQALAPALRITRSEYDHSARISEIVAMQAASIASSEGVRGELEAYSGSVDGGIRSSARSGRAGSGRRGHSAGRKGSAGPGRRGGRVPSAGQRSTTGREEYEGKRDGDEGEDKGDDEKETEEEEEDGTRTGRADDRNKQETEARQSERDMQLSKLQRQTAAGLRALGEVVAIDLLQMPVPPAQVKGWAISQFSQDTHPPFWVHRLPHPVLATQGAAAALAQALKVKYRLPSHVVVPDKLQVARWQAHNKSDATDSLAPTQPGARDLLSGAGGGWVASEISDVDYNPDTRVVSFATVHMAPHAVVQSRAIDLPYSSWSLTPIRPVTNAYTLLPAPAEGIPVQDTAALFSIVTPRFTVSIAIEPDGQCVLLAPLIPETRFLVEVAEDGQQPVPMARLPVGQMLVQLERCGISLLPLDGDADLLAAEREQAALSRAAENAATASVHNDSEDHNRDATATADEPGDAGRLTARTVSDASLDAGLVQKDTVGDEGKVAATFLPPLRFLEFEVEKAAYADVARACIAFAFRDSRWNSHPATATDTAVLRARELLLPPMEGFVMAAPAATEPSESAWRMMSYVADAEVPGPLKMRVAVVADTEGQARAAWDDLMSNHQVGTSLRSGSDNNPAGNNAHHEATPAPLSPLAISANVPTGRPPATSMMDPQPVTPVPPHFEGEPEPNAGTHVTTARALEARASPEALTLLSRSSPAFVKAVGAALRLVRPLRFTQ